MENYRKRRYKGRISFFVLMGLFVLFLILSFFSINNVYGFDSENITTSDIAIYNNTNDIINNVDNSLGNHLNQNNTILDNKLDYYNGSIYNKSNITENFESSNDTLNVPKTIPNGDGVKIYDESQITHSTSVCSDSDAQCVYSDNSYLNDNYKNNKAYLTDNEDNLVKLGEKSSKFSDISNLMLLILIAFLLF